MKARTRRMAGIWFCLVIPVVLGPSCSRPAVAGRAQAAAKVLSAADAAQLAAGLANQECERRFKRRPFAANQHVPVLKDGEYRWGGLDEGGPGGYSALVIFDQDGSYPKVEVYFSSDQLSPMR